MDEEQGGGGAEDTGLQEERGLLQFPRAPSRTTQPTFAKPVSSYQTRTHL